MPSTPPKKANPDELIQIVLDYLQGKPIRVIRESLAAQAEEFYQGCKSLYIDVSLENKTAAKNDKYINALFLSLHIDKDESKAELKKFDDLIDKSDNLYALLNNLHDYGHLHHHKGQPHLAYLIGKIDSTTTQHWWELYFAIGATLSAGLGGFFYFRQDYLDEVTAWFERILPTVGNWLNKTFSLLRNTPLIGIGYNAIALLIHWYYTLTETTTPEKRLSGLIFKTLNRGLVIAAHVLSYLAAGVMTTPAVIFFILGSAIDVLESLYDLNTAPLPDEAPKVGCELLSMKVEPTLNKLNTLKISANAAYIRVHNETESKLFYVNIALEQCVELKHFDTFDITMHPTKQARTLSEAELNQITSITRHTHKALKNEWGKVAEYERSINWYQRKRNAVWIKLGAAILITASVIVCCIFPPSLVISLSCMIFSWLVTLAKDSIITSINAQSDYALQKAITLINVKKDPRLVPALAPELQNLAAKTEQLDRHEAALSERERRLAERERKLHVREKAIKETLTAVSLGESSTAQALRGLYTPGQKKSPIHTPSAEPSRPTMTSSVSSANDEEEEKSQEGSESSVRSAYS